MTTTSPASASSSALPMAAARSGSTSTGPGTPARISSMIACGSSLRGLSEVTMTASASRDAISPMRGRLPRSRSPPQPKMQTSRPVARLCEQRLERARGVRVVDEDRERLAFVDRLEAPGHAGEVLDSGSNGFLVDAEDARRRHGAEHVLDVEAAAEAGGEVELADTEARAGA